MWLGFFPQYYFAHPILLHTNSIIVSGLTIPWWPLFYMLLAVYMQRI